VLVASITGSVTSFIGNHGVYAVFLLTAVGAVFPAATELVFVYAGAVASGAFPSQHVVLFGHEIDSNAAAYITMALAGTLGYLVGSVGGWCIGRYGGRPFIEQYGRYLHVSHARLERAERWFDVRENWAVLIGCATPVLRSFVAIPAGLFRMRFTRFMLLAIPGSTAFAFVFTGIGWAVGANWKHFHQLFDIALLAGAAVIALYLVLRVASSRLKRHA
jgi:membrane protein DedA with SNARE-associated domain